jgi:hypothetical protein
MARVLRSIAPFRSKVREHPEALADHGIMDLFGDVSGGVPSALEASTSS